MSRTKDGKRQKSLGAKLLMTEARRLNILISNAPQPVFLPVSLKAHSLTVCQLSEWRTRMQ